MNIEKNWKKKQKSLIMSQRRKRKDESSFEGDVKSYHDLIVSLTTLFTVILLRCVCRIAFIPCACLRKLSLSHRKLLFFHEAMSSSFKLKPWAKTVQFLCFASARTRQSFFSLNLKLFPTKNFSPLFFSKKRSQVLNLSKL